MDTKARELFGARARVIKAVAHPASLLMVDELSRGPRCVCELAGMVGADVSTVSKHLNVLRTAGILNCEKRGLQVFYSLKCPCIMQFFACVETVLRTNAREQAALVGTRR